MAFIDWKDTLSVGVELFDNDHKKLVALANSLHDSISVGAQQGALAPILDELVKYTVFHFGHEEGMMIQYAYPDYEKHKKEHDALVEKVQDYYDQVMEGKTAISLSLIGFLKDWLVNHIMGSDQAYKEFFKSRGVK
ncbi:MAG TPA: bacteriohemerythrin [Spirochaetota bacterium]|nr:bacteriohemerythrin [Spirochaetota bacterium]HPJ36250.1 bacteriohemerythrin [Spirochaetota bacterium]